MSVTTSPNTPSANPAESRTPPGEPQIPGSPSSLDALQSDEQRQLLNIVDSLRQCGLEGIISLPQLVVCGDQSSGKSSVLEAITEIPFPSRENLCTRFATEIILRRSPTHSVKTRIIPEETRPKEERVRLEEFGESISDFSELPGLIDKATKLMGLAEAADQNTNAFASDVLSIEISGPDRPQLTLVDLPGLIHSENKAQSNEDIQLVRDLVERYISNPRTIILAIISAKNDYANQIILKNAREFDKKGTRTLGVITKPDDLHADSGNESAFISLAMNEDIFFKLGWHVLRNRDFTERHHSFEQRNQSEKSFFSKGNWHKLSSDMLGVQSLRVRLSDLLFHHIKQELPKLRDELNESYEETLQSLQALGQKRSTVLQQKEYLMQLSLKFYDITKAGVNGHYESRYFGGIDTESEFGVTFHERRLRAAVQFLNFKFAKSMREIGHTYTLDELISLGDYEPPEDSDSVLDNDVDTDQDEDDSESNAESDESSPHPQVLDEEEAQSWVKQVLIRTRGRELPGNYNPLLIGELFWEQSKNWRKLAEDHLNDVARLCSNFVMDLLQDISPSDVCKRIHAVTVEEALKKRLEAGEAELNKLLEDRERYPMTYNHYFTTTIQKMRRERNQVELDRCLKNGSTTSKLLDKNFNTVETIQVDRDKVVSDFHQKLELDMDNFSCHEVLNDLHAFYKITLKTFIDNVAVQVIERHIVYSLEEVFSPLVVTALEDEDISNLASESQITIRQRDYLEGRKGTLEKGRKVFKSILSRKT